MLIREAELPLPLLRLCVQVFKSYRIKAAALLFSQFKEVLFLDADIVSVEDPTFLFELKEYKETGAIFWPDFWGSSMAPDFLNVTGLTPDQVR